MYSTVCEVVINVMVCTQVFLRLGSRLIHGRLLLGYSSAISLVVHGSEVGSLRVPLELDSAKSWGVARLIGNEIRLEM